MYYKIIEKFSPSDEERWQNYLNWRQLDLTCFDSIDGILKPDLFNPKSQEDWANCVNEDFKLHLITNLNYARKILQRYHNANIVGVETELDEVYESEEGLLEYDIIDGSISVLTNWGTDTKNLINPHLMPNGLIGDLTQAFRIRNLLRQKFPDDSHVKESEVWAVYCVDEVDKLHDPCT
jgi:hypothetical protein|tara:strand:- start:1918 stop:2454 length:537 start_codon:yes stop_codon:yes gene_type:complete